MTTEFGPSLLAATRFMRWLCGFFRRWRARHHAQDRAAEWPNATLYCVRHQEHPSVIIAVESYPAGYPNIFGPPRTEPRCVECGALMYVASIEVIA